MKNLKIHSKIAKWTRAITTSPKPKTMLANQPTMRAKEYIYLMKAKRIHSLYIQLSVDGKAKFIKHLDTLIKVNSKPSLSKTY